MSEDAPINIVGLNYVTIYYQDLQAAEAFYTAVFGPPDIFDENVGPLYGWKMGRTWLTIFPGKAGPTAAQGQGNAEFAIQVALPAQVDALHARLLNAGATSFMAPHDTEMYETMRFCCLDDPFGFRIDVYCPLPPVQESTN